MEVTIDKLTGNPLLVEVKESVLETALQAKVNQGKVAGTFSTGMPTNPVSDKVYDFAGTNATLIGGITWYNGDSAFWDGSAWTRIPAQVMDNELSKKITKKLGANLFNPSEFKSGYYLNTSGVETVNSSWGVTGFIPFTESDVNLISNFYAPVASGGKNILYDSYKNFIANFQGNIATWQANVAYVRFSGSPIPNTNIVLVNKGTTLNSYTPYTEVNQLVNEEAIINNSVTTDKIKDEAITSAKLLNASVIPDKTNFFELGKNLFNPNDSGVALGYYVLYASGNLSANPSYNATGFIPVIGGQNYTMSYKHQMAWYDANKVYISGSSSSDTNPTQQAPANAAFCRCTVYTTSWGHFQFELGTQQTSYEAYGFKIKQEYIKLTDYYPELSLTRKLHILAGQENSVYHKSVIKRWLPYHYPIQSSGTNWEYYERYSRVNNTTAGNLTYKVLDGITLSEKQVKTITVVVGNTTTNNGAKIVQVIGDSFTYNGYWFDKANQLCPALTFVGMRKSYNTLLKAEGRGGWRLSTYMTQIHSIDSSFSPFLHPADPYKYYGNTAFWIAVKAGSGDYGIAGFTDIANTIGFNATTGLKAVPAANDVMYNDANARYEVYNGSAWVEISESTLAFTFNYGKYLTTWGITMPDIVGILLGANDFRTTVLTDATFATWKTNMDTLLTSVRSAATALGKTVKIAICLPATETASVNNSAYINPIIQRANMFDARRRIIEAFDIDTYSNVGVDVVDTGSALDGDYGFDMTELKPYADYSLTQRELMSTNVPHPSNGGYAQIGVRFAAYIQSVR